MQPFRFSRSAGILLALTLCGLPATDMAAEAGRDQDRPLPDTLQRLARDYRIEVYNTFRTNRNEFERRRRALDRVVKIWREAGARPEDEAAMAEWLNQARIHSRRGATKPLPALPMFSAKQDRGGTRKLEKEIEKDTLAEPSPLSDSIPDAAGRPLPTPAPRVAEEKLARVPAEQPSRIRQPDLELPRASVPAPEAATIDPARAASSPAPPSSIRDLPKRPADLKAAIEPIETPEIEAAPAPVIPQEIVVVNRIELDARIRGHNLALRNIEGQFLARENWTAVELARLVAMLAELADRRSDAETYLRLLDADLRQTMPRLASPEFALVKASEQIAAMRERLEHTFFAGSHEARNALDLLKAAQFQLAELGQQQP